MGFSTRDKVEFHWRTAEQYWRGADYAAARAELRKVRNYPDRGADLIIGTSVWLSILKEAVHDYGGSLAELLAVQPIIRICDDRVIEAKWNSALGIGYRKLLDPAAGAGHHERAYALHRREGAREWAASSLNNLALCQLDRGDLDGAGTSVERAMADCCDDIALANFKTTKAKLLAARGHFDAARALMVEAASFLAEMGESTFARDARELLGEIVVAEAWARVRA